MDDIADRLEDALESDRTLDPFDLDADDRDNSIVLTGRVQTAEQKALTEQIARQIAAIFRSITKSSLSSS
ncbi:BON domain-containing protein [Microcoleus vaginatus]|uniref:BON domain-containing protein n=1 Tax=Microcoleus vaginatus TaxID=119532 RepID=UPI001F6064AB|nr:BON domain-containing protein [Microcoleus vaginatus HSN003]